MKITNQENIKLMKSFYEVASRGDCTAARLLLDTNVEWLEPPVPGLWFSGTHRGAEAVCREVLSPAMEKFEKFHLKIRRLYAVGDHVIGVGYVRGRARMTGKELNALTAHVCTIRNSKIVRFEGFHDTAGWLDALGLASPEAQRMAA